MRGAGERISVLSNESACGRTRKAARLEERHIDVRVFLLTLFFARRYGGEMVPEGFLDAIVAGMCINLPGAAKNSPKRRVYCVKPKCHGPEEVALTVAIMENVEKGLGLAKSTIRIGIMDEERRTSCNLEACIYEARDRVCFINTGFLDRTGDEVRTCSRAGPVATKKRMKEMGWLKA
jgi:malate synthase